MSQVLCTTSAVNENQAVEFELEGRSVILVNWYGNWYGYRNDCPHAGWPLNIQPDVFFDSDKQFLQCSNHMALFEVETGICQAGPCVGDRLKPLKIEIRDGQVLAEL